MKINCEEVPTIRKGLPIKAYFLVLLEPNRWQKEVGEGGL